MSWFGSGCCGGTYIASVGSTSTQAINGLNNQCGGSATQIAVSQAGFPNVTCTPPPPQNYYWYAGCCNGVYISAASTASYANAYDAMDAQCTNFAVSNTVSSFGPSAPFVDCNPSPPPPPPPPPGPSFTEALVTDGTLGKVYSDGVSANNTSSYAIASGSLPPGLSLNTSSGAITGTPTQQGSFTFVITASGGGGSTGSGNLTIQIFPAGNRRNDVGFDVNLANAKRYDGTNWVNLSNMKRFDGTNWINISN